MLCGLGVAAVGSLAGCSGITNQSFEAKQVGLSDDAQAELGLAEVDSETVSVSQDGPTGNVSVSITNHAAIFSRAAGLGGE